MLCPTSAGFVDSTIWPFRSTSAAVVMGLPVAIRCRVAAEPSRFCCESWPLVSSKKNPRNSPRSVFSSTRCRSRAICARTRSRRLAVNARSCVSAPLLIIFCQKIPLAVTSTASNSASVRPTSNVSFRTIGIRRRRPGAAGKGGSCGQAGTSLASSAGGRTLPEELSVESLMKESRSRREGSEINAKPLERQPCVIMVLASCPPRPQLSRGQEFPLAG